MDTGESHIRSSLGTLKNCLVGSWKERSDALSSVKEVQSWAKVVWRLKEGGGGGGGGGVVVNGGALK